MRAAAGWSVSVHCRPVNDHPEVRLKLLTEVSRALEDCSRLMPAERATLAEKVERWRYQLLNHNAGHLSDDQSELTQRLDLLMNQLSGSEPRPPRSLLSIFATTRSQPLSAEIEACLDPRRPLQAVEAAARVVTDRHFAAGDGSASRPMLLYMRPCTCRTTASTTACIAAFAIPTPWIASNSTSPRQSLRPTCWAGAASGIFSWWPVNIPGWSQSNTSRAWSRP